MNRFLAGLLALALLASPSFAQAPPSPAPTSVVAGYVPISVSSVTARGALPGTAASLISVTLDNVGATDAFCVSGGSSVVATTSSPIFVGAGKHVTFWSGSDTNVACITAASTTIVDAYHANGPFDLGGAASSGGGSTTANQGTPNAGGATNSWPVQGAGVAGTPAGGVVSVQGVSGGTPQSVGGYEFNVSVIPTVQNAAYAIGQSLGGLQTISIGSTNNLTGILTQIQAASKGGSTVAPVFYVWDKLPAATTCTDKTNFVGSQTDNQHLIVSPQSVAMALAVSAQDATAYGAATNLVGNFSNASTNTNLYLCALASAAVTPATTTDYRFNIQGTKDQP